MKAGSPAGDRTVRGAKVSGAMAESRGEAGGASPARRAKAHGPGQVEHGSVRETLGLPA